ncbi:hypothetical protein [Hoeflea prorocentri]|uniref:Glycosyl transferase family 2 n=1 Tax=Hoeflea prorocentri TaxID=1922333 RepID=A0A9X3ZGK4_9HYPH|nr:hypothetical protein [Hoeflea prorocentri]MCY6379993.1 hypothetical protein [Hoeflea prorocentri]MDA5397793.1 hypothetical protein [Hoeflea prorocentri]
MISIVIVGRNDNYGGDFEDRLFSTSLYNLKALEARGVEAELVFVEWNPLPGRPLLSEKLLSTIDKARCIVVDASIHRLISENRHIKLFEYHAKNAGAARARGSWLLLTNPDNYFGDDVLEFLQKGNFETRMLYRAGWIDIEDASSLNDPSLSDNHASDIEPYCMASGDFIFCSRSLFHEIGGFREDLTFSNTHKDAIFCTAAFEHTAPVQKIGNTYHLSHGRPGQNIRRVDFDWRKVDRQPQDSFGLTGDDIITTQNDRLTTLTLPDHLQRAAMERTLPEPVVPQAYRPPQPSVFRHPRKTLKRLLGLR